MKFTDKIKEWGNVLILSLPRSKMEAEGLKKGTRVEVEIKRADSNERL